MFRVLSLAMLFAALLLTSGNEARAENECGKLQRIQGSDVLVNICRTCQNIHIVRSRGGGALPEVRSYRVEKQSKISLPFKGPGSTRITATDACTPELGNERQAARQLAEVNATCILKAELANGYVLLNRCPACRQTIVRWRFLEGGERNVPVTIEPRATLNVPRGSEIGFGVIHEEPCKG